MTVKKHPCPCGVSSDAWVEYPDSFYCFRCEKYQKKVDDTMSFDTDTKGGSISMQGDLAPIIDRRLPLNTVKFYGVLQRDGKHMYPYYKDGKQVAYKTRLPDKAGFPWTGTPQGVELFGQPLFPSGGNTVTIVEGELDALAGYEMLKEPVVSVCSASTAVNDLKRNYEWVNSFKKIVLAFDNDKAGQDAQQKCATLFDPKKVRIMKLSLHKDASDYLKFNNMKEFYESHRNAGVFTPDGIVPGSSIYDILAKKAEYSAIKYPWSGVNDYTYGLRTGELVTVIAGTGVGKTQFLRELIYGILNNSEDNIGCLFLEEPIRDTGLGMLSIHANKKLYLPNEEYTQEEFDEAFKSTLGTGRLFLYDSFGSNSIDRILGIIRYLVRSLGCKYIILDHISIIVSDQSSGDERRALDEIATKLKTLTVELGVCVIMAAHLRRQPNGQSHEEGAAVSLSDIRGTAGIGQLSNIILGLERNTQADDPSERHTVRVRVVKNRFSGLTGLSTHLRYHKETGRLIEDNPDTPVEEPSSVDVSDFKKELLSK